jgi:hypothetical protein
MVELLLSRGARTGIRDRVHEATPLRWSTYDGRPRAVTALLEGAPAGGA